jgi:hypothetical protein
MQILSRALHVFSPRCFKVSGLTLRPLIHVELIFVEGERQGSSFNLLHVRYAITPKSIIEEAVFSRTYVFDSFVKNEMAVAVWISGFSIPLH